MRIFFIAATTAAVNLSGAAFAQEQTTCAKGADIRVIEVIAPGEVGAACDVRYSREAGLNISVPFHANSDAAFCSAKSREVVEGLKASGFLCAAGASAPRGGAESAPTLEASASAPFPVVEAADVEADVAAQRAALEEALVGAEKTTPVAAAAPSAPSAPSANPAAKSPPALAVQSAAHISSSAQAAPSAVAQPQGPVDLTVNARLPQSRAPKPAAAGAGRLRGATPPLFAAAAGDQAGAGAAGRPAEDVIKGVLAAQAAAWNENDLDGFLAAYWQSPFARFVAGGEVVSGFDAISDVYKSTYGATGDLGKLALSDLSVQLVTEDVATVVGRFRLENAKGVETGGYTLVMRRTDGRWRIAHDHSVVDGK